MPPTSPRDQGMQWQLVEQWIFLFLHELLDDCMNTSLKTALSSIKAFALSQNGNGHLGILQHHFDLKHASIPVMGQMGIVGVDIPSELNRSP